MASDSNREILVLLREIQSCLVDQKEYFRTQAEIVRLLVDLKDGPSSGGDIKSVAVHGLSDFRSDKVDGDASSAPDLATALNTYIGPQTVYYSFDEKDVLLPLDVSRFSKPGLKIKVTARSLCLVSGENWKYWRPLQGLYSLLGGRGRPDYVPEWEVVRRNHQGWRHVDDLLFSRPVEASFRNSVSDPPDSPGTTVYKRYIPYSFSPPPDRRLPFPRAGLGDVIQPLTKALGQLCSVPPDARVPLSFELHNLRALWATGSLPQYMAVISQLLYEIRKIRGCVEVIDIDDFGHSFTYHNRHQSTTKETGAGDEFIWGVSPALDAEEYCINIPPTVYYLENTDDTWSYSPRSRIDDRPWYRIINLQGLASLALSPITYTGQEQRDPDRLWRPLFAEGCGGADLDKLLTEAFTLHLQCRPRREPANPYTDNWKPFHITWFRLCSLSADLKDCATNWGTLYGSQPEREIQKVACTIGILPMGSLDHCHQPGHAAWRDIERVAEERSFYWTILLLAPLHLTVFRNTWESSVPSRYWDRSPRVALLELIKRAITDAVESWTEIFDYLSSIIEDSEAILDPETHDGLLVDDDRFSRSRRHFWAVSSLNVFIDSIENSVAQWRHFWDARKDALRVMEACNRRGVANAAVGSHVSTVVALEISFEEAVKQVEREAARLDMQAKRFGALREKAVELRDSLFNASSVIESHEATRLGQNVKLLTFVSIFYLPLGFCVAVWSINESYSVRSLGLAVLCVGAATYVTVANIDLVARAARLTYGFLLGGSKDRLVDLMSRDADPYWSSLGREFKQYRHPREYVKPTEWLIPLFMVVRVLRRVGVLKRDIRE